MAGIKWRFTEPIAEWLQKHEEQLWEFAERVSDLLSVEKELARVSRGKTFDIYNESVWRMLQASADAVITDLASWALGFYEPGGGGFLRQLTGPDLEALTWKFRPGEGPPPAASEHWRELAKVAREEAYGRLFRLPHALSSPQPGPRSKPWPSDYEVQNLCANLQQRFQKLHDDRNQYRAHKYEHKQPKTAQQLDLDDVRKYVEACQGLLRDLRLLASDSNFSASGYEAKARDDDSFAQDIVDLLLCGSFTWILLFGPGKESGEHYIQKRDAYYARLHAEHDAIRAPADPTFNRRK